MHIYATDGVHTAELDIPRNGTFVAVPMKNCLALSSGPIRIPASEIVERTVVVSISDGDYVFGTTLDAGNTPPD
jgi:hypothetical protein